MNAQGFRLLHATLLLVAGFFSVPAAQAQATGAVDCSIARDPARCEAHQAALAACADQRGKAKSACLAEHMPPVDCSKAANPNDCAAAERAKLSCSGLQGKALSRCIKEQRPQAENGKTVRKGKHAKTRKPARKPRRD